ncbi:DJ-1/PfpI family protein [Shinella oryzae]|uniref:DJ-1/PfpI family protein n=1 Tax=Shinella oryzae TaxID=2871820 RepID=A0ABY9K8S4_9HYPH|nr:DJ-1/PfpI family protein [Shinella oryzae]WLS04957.1 DJ-1/PfpI family protein [Shinella oryzae]
MRLRKAFFLLLLLLRPAWATTDLAQISLPTVKSDRSRPLIAILADDAGTETTDLIVPFGVLKAANVADVVIVSTKAGMIRLMPALVVEPDMTIEAFDGIYPEGADIVIVPAMHDSKNESVINWVRQQARKRAFIAAICEGAWIVARAGVLDGRNATTHWYALDDIARQFPKTRWIRNKR